MNSSHNGESRKAGPGQQNTGTKQDQDQDREPPRTAVPPGQPKAPLKNSGSDDPKRDQDSDPPRTAVPPKQR
jgi:hypothetical protein